MATTQLSPTAIPGRRYSFEAKQGAAAPAWEDATFIGVDTISGEFVAIVGKILVS